ncbi:hypothetical protein [Deinococcus aerolatus]|uniref:hypothetical protein n=1 Tax=Deinococcus aerolatus TaxID=522487 RepID=UPI00166EC565|nr:hypothetical protein [Deinococcus aerolatus]
MPGPTRRPPGFLGESRLAVLQAERVIGVQHTEMGRMYQLLARGRVSLFHTASDALSLVAQLDRGPTCGWS